MSNLVVQVAQIEKVEKHDNSDRLEIVSLLGWDTVVPKGEFAIGDKAVFIPYDTLITAEVAEKLGVTKYLKGRLHNRVGHINLRGRKSYGIVTKPLDPNWEIGKDVSIYYGATKYIPPPISNATGGKHGQIEKENPRFGKYTDIENIKNYKYLFKEQEVVIATEKIHGSSSRISSINGKILCGSRNLQRKPPGYENIRTANRVKKWFFKLKDYLGFIKINIEACRLNWYWFPYSIEGVRNFLSEEGKKHESVILYGETYGKVQFMEYEVQVTEYNPKGLAFAAYDIKIDDKFLDDKDFRAYCSKYNIPVVPIVYNGPYDLDRLKSICNGSQTIIGNKCHIAEGLVIRPIKERSDDRFGRVVLKLINDEYLDQLGDKDNTDI